MSHEQIKARLDEIESSWNEIIIGNKTINWVFTQLRESLAREEELKTELQMYRQKLDSTHSSDDYQKLKAERDQLRAERDEAMMSCGYSNPDNEPLIVTIKNLRADLQMVTDFLEHKSTRSSYLWSQGGEYLPCDYSNEAQIVLAAELLSKLKSRPKTEGAE